MTSLETGDGEVLEALWDHPEGDARGTVIFCHPHPLHGGTMRAPLMNHVTDGLVARGFSVLRFNFRGVGNSTGEHGNGTPELADISAAWETAGRIGPSPRLLAGWSFGAATSLLWMAETDTAVPWAGIAPPVRSDRTPELPLALPQAPRAFILGDRDQFASVDDVRAYVDTVSGELHVIEGSDHFFYFREEMVAELIAKAFGWVDSSQP